MPPPEKPPRFFVDRSLGRIAVPRLLRADGWDLITLSEHYGMPADESVADTEWIKEAAGRGWPILMKDKRIRTRHAEAQAVVENQARCFVITRGDLTSEEMANRFLANKAAIMTAAASPGPFLYSVQGDRLLRLRTRQRPITQELAE